MCSTRRSRTGGGTEAISEPGTRRGHSLVTERTDEKRRRKQSPFLMAVQNGPGGRRGPTRGAQVPLAAPQRFFRGNIKRCGSGAAFLLFCKAFEPRRRGIFMGEHIFRKPRKRALIRSAPAFPYGLGLSPFLSDKMHGHGYDHGQGDNARRDAA